MNVLILCDDLMFTSKVSATGRAVGVPTAAARTAEAAVRRAAEVAATCVLVDLHNPGLDLPMLLADLREKCPAMPRVIGFGSHVDVVALKAARKAGCDLVLPRSQFSEQLEAKLTEWAKPVTSSECPGSGSAA